MPFSKSDSEFERNLKEYISDVSIKEEILVDLSAENAENTENSARETEQAKTPHAGHRARMIAKSKKESLNDNELLELLLFYAIPRRNTSDIAHALLARYGSLQAVFNAGAKELKENMGIGENAVVFLKNVNELCLRYGTEKQQDSPLKLEVPYEKFWNELDKIYSDEKCEVVDVYLLDSQSKIFNSTRLATGDFNSVEFQPPLLTKFLLDHTPAGIVIVHNHPSGDTTPSSTDKMMTEKCQLLCSLHNVMFCDHIIYGRGHKYSYYDSGKLQPISVNYSVENIIAKAGTRNGGK